MVNIYFSGPLNPATVNATTVNLFTNGNVLVPQTISYTAAQDLIVINANLTVNPLFRAGARQLDPGATEIRWTANIPARCPAATVCRADVLNLMPTSPRQLTSCHLLFRPGSARQRRSLQRCPVALVDPQLPVLH